MSGDRHQENREPGYLAWDGNNYEGDPPQGWYLAKDNRWWPSEQIINESNGYSEPYVSEPYKKAYLDDDEAYGPEYRYDPAFDDADPTVAANPTWSAPSLTQPEPSKAESPSGLASDPSFRPPEVTSTNATPPLELRLRQSNESPSRLSPPPPRQVASADRTSGPDLTASPGRGRARVPSRPQAPAGPRKRSQRGRGISIILFAAIALARCVGGAGDNDSTETNFPRLTTPVSINIDEFGNPRSTPFIAAPGETISGPTPCPAADRSSVRTTRFEEPPPMCIDLDKDYEADLITDRGTISIALDHKTAPIAVNNFIVLSRYRYYDDVPFHEIVRGGWVQTGEPLGPSQSDGGPGYSIEVEPPPAGDYPVDSVFFTTFEGAPHGAQFAFATSPRLGSVLDSKNSRFGSVVDGFDTLAEIESGPLSGATALDPAYILRIQIREL